MKALCWHGKNDIRCDTVPDPTIEAIVPADRTAQSAPVTAASARVAAAAPARRAAPWGPTEAASRHCAPAAR